VEIRQDVKLLAMSFASVVLFFLIGTPFALLDARTFLHDLQFQSMVITQQQSIGGFISTILNYCRELFLPGHWSWNGEFFGFFILLGMGMFLIRPEKKDLVFLPFLVLHFLFFTYKTSSSFLKPHYLLPIIPLFYLFGAKGFVKLAGFIKTTPQKRSAIAYAASAVLLLSPLSDVVRSDHQRTLPDTGNLARQWIESNFPADAKILAASAHHLSLKESKESLLANRATDNRKASDEKLKALMSYTGKTYYVSHLYHGWGFVAEDKLEQLEHVPEGVTLVDKQKLTLGYWRSSGYQYVIVFGDQDEQGYPEEAKYPTFREFFDELLAEATLLKEFLPVAYQQSGLPVRIYRLDQNTSGS
jgi:hypothetical protein